MTCMDKDEVSVPSSEATQENSKEDGVDGPHRRRRQSMGELASKTLKKVESIVLYAFHQAPSYQQDNQYILSGYRGELNSVKRCIQSLWYLHNESGNSAHFRV